MLSACLLEPYGKGEANVDRRIQEDVIQARERNKKKGKEAWQMSWHCADKVTSWAES